MAKGAVARGLELATLVRKKCPRHYGLMLSRPYNAATDRNRSDTYTSTFQQQQIVPGTMSWYFSQNGDITPERMIPVPFRCPLKAHERTITVRLRSCDQKEPPQYYDPAVVKTVCDIAVDLRHVELSRYAQRTVRGQTIYQVELILEMLLGPRYGLLVFRVRLGEHVVGHASVPLIN
ncbi:hypothetical protein AbraIFM66950_006615 [Aspergillus brasiliensis]|nr:hypothetical protein AbraIFM66950_006615 [Aspergillus brasiliensis]